jgi:hypothetical protein
MCPPVGCQMAEVVVPRAQFAEILRGIDGRSRYRHERRSLDDRTPAGQVGPRFEGALQAAIPVAFERPRRRVFAPHDCARAADSGKLSPWPEMCADLGPKCALTLARNVR